MKKMFVLLIVVLAISLGFTSCDSDSDSGGGLFSKRGGTLKLINDTQTRYSFSILFDGNTIRVNDGQTSIQPSQTIQAVSDTDTSYVVYLDGYFAWTGQLNEGKTIELRFSTRR